MECSDRTQLYVDAKSRDTCFDLFSVHVRESNGKGKIVPVQVTKMYGSVEIRLHSILIATLDRHELSASRSCRSNSRERQGRTKDEGTATPTWSDGKNRCVKILRTDCSHSQQQVYSVW
jgi:hypothetical protein